MNFNNLEEIKSHGFQGFQKISDLQSNPSPLPNQMGVYFVLRLETTPPSFLEKGCGGFFKGKDPNVSLLELKDNWVDGAMVVYIGKAGSLSGDATLKSRLKQYLSFGQGKNIGHYGGRLIWQLKDSKDLVLCWKSLSTEEPRDVENDLIREFRQLYGKRPFANLTD
jgi:hypothetical protein